MGEDPQMLCLMGEHELSKHQKSLRFLLALFLVDPDSWELTGSYLDIIVARVHSPTKVEITKDYFNLNGGAAALKG